VRRLNRPGIFPALLLLSPLLFGAGGCEIEKPEMPTFTTTLNIPLGEERIDLAEVIEDQEFLVVGDDSTLTFSVEGDPDTLGLDFEFEAEIEATDIDAKIGPFEVGVVDPTSFDFTVGELYPGALFGVPVVVPPFDFDLESDPEPLAGLTSATVESGGLLVTLTNNLPVPVAGASPPALVIITLQDGTTGAPIASVTFAEKIPAGGTDSRTADLAGAVLSGSVTVAITGGSPGSTGTVIIQPDNHIQVTAELVDLTMTEAEAEIDPQSFETEYCAALPDTIELVEAEILGGTLAYSLTNDLPIPCEAQLVWPEILDQDEQPLVSTVPVAEFSTAQGTVELAGRTIKSPDEQPLSELNIQVLVTSPGSGGQSVVVSATDGLQASVDSTALELGAVTGSFPPQRFPIDPVDEEIDLPEELDGISLQAASLVLTVGNGTGMPANLDMTLTGTAAGGGETTLAVAGEIAPAIGRAFQETHIVLDETNSEILAFLNAMPTSLTLAGDVLVGGEDVVGTVAPGDQAVVSWRIESPLEVIIEEAQIDGDPDCLDLDQDTRDLINDHAAGARVSTEIVNSLPFAVEIRIYAGQDTTTITDQPPLVELHDVAPGEIDPILHTVVAPTVSRPQIVLSQEDARIFGLPDVYTAIEVILPSTNGEPVRVRSTDYLTVTGIVSLEISVHD